jgi:hypothetical protein
LSVDRLRKLLTWLEQRDLPEAAGGHGARRRVQPTGIGDVVGALEQAARLLDDLDVLTIALDLHELTFRKAMVLHTLEALEVDVFAALVAHVHRERLR